MAFCILNAVKNSHENTKYPKIQHITMFAFIPLGKKNGFTKKIANNDAITDAAKSKHKTTVELK